MRIFSSSGSLAGHRDVLRLLPSGAQVVQVFLAILHVHPLGTEVSQNSGPGFKSTGLEAFSKVYFSHYRLCRKLTHQPFIYYSGRFLSFFRGLAVCIKVFKMHETS